MLNIGVSMSKEGVFNFLYHKITVVFITQKLRFTMPKNDVTKALKSGICIATLAILTDLPFQLS